MVLAKSAVDAYEIWGLALIIGGAALVAGVWVWWALTSEAARDLNTGFWDALSGWKTAAATLGTFVAVAGIIVLLIGEYSGPAEEGDPCDPGEEPPAGFECK